MSKKYEMDWILYELSKEAMAALIKRGNGPDCLIASKAVKIANKTKALILEEIAWHND